MSSSMTGETGGAVDVRTAKCPQCGARLAEVAVVCPRCGRRNPLGHTRRSLRSNRAPMPVPTVPGLRSRNSFDAFWNAATRGWFKWTWYYGMRNVGVVLGISLIFIVRLLPIAPGARLFVYVTIPVVAVVVVFGEGPYRARKAKREWRKAMQAAAPCSVCTQTIPAGRAVCSNCGARRASSSTP